tara:strand:+ start:10 stop:420 length:411 start_codon:yes stop_codon:yes gene_type:complete
MKILIIHGPNMNLFGLRSAKLNENITLDKINKHIRKYVRNLKLEIKIIQTHNEDKVVSYLHRNRTKFDGLILTPGVWQKNAYILNDTIDLINLPYYIIKLDKTEASSIFNTESSIYEKNIYKAFEVALNNFINFNE